MTTPIDPFERQLPDLLPDLAAARTPDYLIDILGQTARTRQRPAWATPGRWNSMLSFGTRPALVAVTATALVVLVGAAFLINRGGQSAAGGPPSPAPTMWPAPSPTPLASPTPSVVTLGNLDQGRSLSPGNYRVAPIGLPFRFTITEDWTVDKIGGGEYAMISGVDRSHGLAVDLPETFYTDPCHGYTGPVASPVPATVDGIVAALAHLRNFTVGPTAVITIDGHPGKEFDLSNSWDQATSTCETGQLMPLWTLKGGGTTATNPGATEHLAVIIVGGIPVIIGWTNAEGISKSDNSVDVTVGTLRFE